MKIPAVSPKWSLAGILLFGLLAMTARPALDPDLWWHLRTGQWIVENGTIPRVDSFSYTRAGQPWLSHEWLSEVLFYEICHHSGFGGLIVFSAAITTAGFLLLYFRCGSVPHWAALATVLGAFASAPAWGVRPQMFTFTLTSLLLWCLERGETRPWILLSIPPMFLLWLNLHAGFALGPALMLAYAFGMAVEAGFGDATWGEVRATVYRIVGLILACLALVPLNPSGAHLYRYPLDTVLSVVMRSSIVEWFSADFHQLRYFPYLLVWLVLLAALAQGRNRPRIRVLVPLLTMAALSLDAVRHIPIFVLLAVPVIAQGLAGSRTHMLLAPAAAKTGSRRPMFVALAVVLLAGFTVTRWVVLAREQAANVTEQFPEKAMAVLAAGDFGGQLFAYYDWGGYAIYKLYPKYRVFVDGRADLYADNVMHEFQTAIQLQTGWRQIIDQADLRAVLVPPHCALAQALVLEPGWQVQYRDSQSVLLVRSLQPAENKAVITKPSSSG